MVKRLLLGMRSVTVSTMVGLEVVLLRKELDASPGLVAVIAEDMVSCTIPSFIMPFIVAVPWSPTMVAGTISTLLESKKVVIDV